MCVCVWGGGGSSVTHLLRVIVIEVKVPAEDNVAVGVMSRSASEWCEQEFLNALDLLNAPILVGSV
jgi:hypothetical protein